MALIGAARARLFGDAATPLTPLRKPLSECRLALVASSVCLAHRGQRTADDVSIGAPRLRIIDGAVHTGELHGRPRTRADVAAGEAAGGVATGGDCAGRAPGDANLERNLALALDRLREAVVERRLGALSDRHLAVCGPMAASARALRRMAPRAASVFEGESLDAVLLVPT